MTETPVTAWTAREALQEMAAHRISAMEYAEVLLDHCATQTRLNAFVTLDRDYVLVTLKSQEKNGKMSGPLAGLPIAFKDAIGTCQFVTTAATPALRDHRPRQDATVVADLRSAGAYVFGKLNMHELSYGITSNNAAFGPVRNPHDPKRIPGGSSGGAGAAVAAGLVPVAIGTDTGGSVRIPAALCGTVGFRPSTGRYAQIGIVPVSRTRDTAGPLTRSVDDAALMDAVLAGVADQLEEIAPNDIRLGVPRNHYLDTLHDDTSTVFDRGIDHLRRAGFEIVPVNVDEVQPAARGCGFPIAFFETKVGLSAYLNEHFSGDLKLDALIAAVKSPDVKSVLSGLLDPNIEDTLPVYQDALKNRRPALQKALAICFSSHRLDALVFPTTILPACPISDDETTSLQGVNVPTFPTFIHNTDPGSVAGLPGLSLPGGMTSNGLPVGIGLDGVAGADRHLLAVGQTVEKALTQ